MSNLEEGLRWLDQAEADFKTAKDCLKDEEMKRRRNPFILEVLEKGKILYKAQVADSQT